MNINLYVEGNHDLEGARSRMRDLLGNADFSGRNFSASKIEEVDQSTLLVEAEIPVHYNPDTEVKEGGVLGVGAQLPSGELLVCVNSEAYREKIGTEILNTIHRNRPQNGFFDLSVHNMEGQAFALASGYRPSSLSLDGRIIYTQPSVRN